MAEPSEEIESEPSEEETARDIERWQEMNAAGWEELERRRLDEKACRLKSGLETLGGGAPRSVPTKKGAIQFIFPNNMALRFDINPGQYLANQGPHINLQGAPGSLDPNMHIEVTK